MGHFGQIFIFRPKICPESKAEQSVTGDLEPDKEQHLQLPKPADPATCFQSLHQ